MLTHVPVQFSFIGVNRETNIDDCLGVTSEQSAMMVSTLTFVPVHMDSLGTNVLPTLMSVNQILV